MKKTKELLITLVGVVLIGVGFYLVKTVDNSQGIMKTLPYLCIGLGCGLFGNGIGDFVSKKTIEKNPKLAKQVEIDTKDERNVMIGNMAKAKGFDIMLYIYSALLLTFALMGISFNVIFRWLSPTFSLLGTIYITSQKFKKRFDSLKCKKRAGY